jgi:protein-export membrane protein SecD
LIAVSLTTGAETADGPSQLPGLEVVLGADPRAGPAASVAMDQTVSIIQDRLNQLGLTESKVQRRGEWQISVEVSGVDDPEQVIEAITKKGVLEFWDVADFGDPFSTAADALASVGATSENELPDGETLILWPAEVDSSDVDQYYMVKGTPPVTGAMLKNASIGFDQSGKPKVNMEFDSEGAAAFADITKAMADTGMITGVAQRLAIVLDGTVKSAPTVKAEVPGGDAEITGNFTFTEARDLALALSTGALPVELVVVSQEQIPAE